MLYQDTSKGTFSLRATVFFKLENRSVPSKVHPVCFLLLSHLFVLDCKFAPTVNSGFGQNGTTLLDIDSDSVFVLEANCLAAGMSNALCEFDGAKVRKSDL